jgi:hypothetical protein
MGLKRRNVPGGSNEQIMRRDMLDPATCRELGGAFDEDGKCVLRKESDPNDPDVLVLRKVNYSKSDVNRKREEY